LLNSRAASISAFECCWIVQFDQVFIEQQRIGQPIDVGSAISVIGFAPLNVAPNMPLSKKNFDAW
jgi:hypothetical protein